MRLSTQTQAGYTLLELMASIAIVSIVSQISLSVFPDFLAKNRADNHVSLLHRNINYGRLYAIENGTYVTLCALKDNQCTKDEWDGQMSLFIDNDKSTSLDTDDHG